MEEVDWRSWRKWREQVYKKNPKPAELVKHYTFLSAAGQHLLDASYCLSSGGDNLNDLGIFEKESSLFVAVCADRVVFVVFWLLPSLCIADGPDSAPSAGFIAS